jgi:hypothetical protein
MQAAGAHELEAIRLVNLRPAIMQSVDEADRELIVTARLATYRATLTPPNSRRFCCDDKFCHVPPLLSG